MIQLESANIQALYLVRKDDPFVELSQSAAGDAFKEDFLDLRTNTSWNEVRSISNRLSCRASKNAIYPTLLDDYNRILIFCAIREHHKEIPLSDLVEVVCGLNGYDLSYWSLRLKLAAWSTDTPAALSRVVTALSQLFGLM